MRDTLEASFTEPDRALVPSLLDDDVQLIAECNKSDKNIAAGETTDDDDDDDEEEEEEEEDDDEDKDDSSVEIGFSCNDRTEGLDEAILCASSGALT